MIWGSKVLYHFFHVRVFEPEGIDTRVQGDRAVPNISRMVNELVLHLHLRVLQPKSLIAVIHIQSAFKYGSALKKLVLHVPVYRKYTSTTSLAQTLFEKLPKGHIYTIYQYAREERIEAGKIRQNGRILIPGVVCGVDLRSLFFLFAGIVAALPNRR